MNKVNIERWGSVASIFGLILSAFLADYRITSLILFTVSLILFVYVGIKYLKKSILNLILKALGLYDEQKGASIREFWFGKSTEINFFKKIDLKSLESIDIFGHTGENIIKEFLDHLEKENTNDVEHLAFRVLLKNPKFESGDRRNGILNSIAKIKKAKRKLNINLQFYNNLPTFRGVICKKKKNGNNLPVRIAYLSYYHFPGPDSKKWSFAFEIDEKNGIQNPIIDKFLSWFDYLWGKNAKNEKEIHTILLDFDDTMVDSHGIQIDAWFEIIKDYSAEFEEEHFTERFMAVANNNRMLRKEIAKVFFEKQSADLIFSEIFQNIPQKKEEEIKDKRFKLRKKKVEEEGIKLFRDCKEELVKLSKNYNLVIISATDEIMIEKYLNKITVENGENRIEFINYFKYIFGRNEPTIGWSALKKKSQAILKAINILGVPSSRLIYIGDNNGDYLASTTIGIEFVEARLFCEKLKKLGLPESLVFSKEERLIIKSWAAIGKIIAELEEKKKNEKYNKLSLILRKV